MKNYNYVFFQTPDDYFQLSQFDLKKMENVVYIDRFPYKANNLIRKLYRLHFSDKINRKFEQRFNIELPFRSFWNPYYFNDHFSNNNPIVFVFCGRYAFWAKYGLIDYLKSKYQNSKYVCFYQDILKDHKRISIEEVKLFFDLVISYDNGDAQKNNIEYHPTFFSKISIEEDDSIPSCDVYFVGAAKDRLKDIYYAYDYLTEHNLKCDFYIVNVPLIQQREGIGLHFISHMDYHTNLKHVIKCKGILEILQKGAVGASLRMKEALVYNKYLLSNIPQTSLFTDEIEKNRFLYVYDNNINEALKSKIEYNEQLINVISAQHFLNFIESRL